MLANGGRVVRTSICVLALLTQTFASCGSEEFVVIRRGGEGANCVRTNDCTAPLECFDRVCVSVESRATDIRVSTDLAPSMGDVRRFEETQLADIVAPQTDLSALDDDVTLAENDLGATTSDDLGGADAFEAPDLENGPTDVLNPIGACDELGIAAEWSGTFDGDIDYDLGMPIPGLVEKDILPVEGTLSFTIQCIEAKLVVLGDMEGVALGFNPFTFTLQGSYSPSTGELTAQMVDGVVDVFGLVQVYFEGDFNGQLVDEGEFSGIWSGDATGNSAGLDAVATGTGTWTATPAS